MERRIAEFNDWIAEWRMSVGGSAWETATEEEKLRNIFWQSCAELNGATIPGSAVLDAIERNVDYADLPVVQQEMLRDLRAKLDDGRVDLATANENEDLAGKMLERIVDAGFFEQSLTAEKNRREPAWSGISEDIKVRRIIEIAHDSGAWTDWDGYGTTPGIHVLETIEREVDYAKLAPWRREGLEGLRKQLDRGTLSSEYPCAVDGNDRVGHALRLVEMEATIQDYKHSGHTVDRPVELHWVELSEEEKLDRIERTVGCLGLARASKPIDIISREVNLARVPLDRRQRAFERRDDDEGEPDVTRPEIEATCEEAQPSLGGDIVCRARQAAGERQDSEVSERDPARQRDRGR